MSEIARNRANVRQDCPNAINRIFCWIRLLVIPREHNRREGEYPTPVYPNVVGLHQVHDLYNGVVLQSRLECMNHTIIKVMYLIMANYTGVYWSRILSLPSIIYSWSHPQQLFAYACFIS